MMFKKLLQLFTGGKSSEEKRPAASAGGGSLRDLEGFVDYVVKSLVDYPV